MENDMRTGCEFYYDKLDSVIVKNMKLRIRLSELEDSSKAVADELDDVANLLFSARMENDRLKEENQKLRKEKDLIESNGHFCFKEENQQQVATKQIWMEAAMEMANHTTANLKEENQQQVATKQIWMEAAMEMANQETK